MRRSTLLLTLALSFLPLAAGAQSLGGLMGSDTALNPFNVSLAPQYPSAYGATSLSFVSSTIDLTNATLTVSVSGKQIYAGNVQPVLVSVGKAGSVTTVIVTITSGGIPYSQKIVLQPQDVSLIPEPVASAPLLYPGKPSVPLEGDTRVVAVANIADARGAILDPASLSYTWTVDGAEIDSASGIGKEAIVVASPVQYRSRDVSVIVQSQAGNLVGQASLSLTPEEPSVQLYENDPLLGIRFTHALESSYTIVGSEATLYAAPFSLPTSLGAPLIAWFLNGVQAQTGNLITLRPTGSGQGTASLSLTANTPGDSLTLAASSLSLLFGAKPSTNFFGL
jgi:hypothetical protein